MSVRATRVLAVAARDLRIELGGRRGAVLPGALGLLLLPLSSAPKAEDLPFDWRVRVSGDVPPAVAASPDVVVVDEAPSIVIVAPPDGADAPWRVRARSIPDALRAPLDTLETRVKVVHTPARPLDVPERSLLFALISASVLTGAVAQSLPGERSNRTLETLRAAAITPLELVLGKWLAWSAFGAVGGLAASAWSILLGRQAPGPWLLAVPWGALVTVALGLWLVRRADDVVGGATIALRTLPAALTLAGVLAWWLGMQDPWWGALVPVGGSLLAAGATWPGWGPTLLACATSALACGALLAATARDLEDTERARPDGGWGAALAVTGTAWLAWWFPVLAPLIWTLGDAAERTAAIPRSSGPAIAAAGLAALATALLARHTDPERLGLRRAGPAPFAIGAAAGLGLAALAGVLPASLAPQATTPLGIDALHRLREAAAPALAGPLAWTVGVLAQEVAFRGWLTSRAGVLGSTLAWTLVVRPADPIQGLAEGVVLALLTTRSRSLLPAVVARLVAGFLSWG